MNRSGRAAANPNLQPLRPKPLPRPNPARREVANAKKRKTSSSMADARKANATLTAAVVTVSDSCARGERQDKSGPAVVQFLDKLKFSVIAREVVADDSIQIRNLLIRLAREVRLIVTTGGTGIAPRDVTPESTIAV